MKRMAPLLMLLAMLLTGCGMEKDLPAEDTAESQLPEETNVGGDVGKVGIPAPKGLTLEMEHAVYDPSVEYYTYFIRNDTVKSTGIFGEDYWVQRLENGQWRNLESANGVAFNSIGYQLQSGGVMALTCWMGAYTEERTPGKYRLVKQIEGENGYEAYILYAEFEIGESAFTAQNPYGFMPLEDLPEDYGAANAAVADVVFTHDGIQNIEAIEKFLFKSELGVNGQLRTVQDYDEGTVLVTDIIYEEMIGNGHFRWKQKQGDIIAERRFSYIVTDGVDIYLSNGADWENTVKYESDKVLLIPEGGNKFVQAVETWTKNRLEWNATRYQVCSDDGVWSSSLSGIDSPTAFSVMWQKQGEGAKGNSYDLRDWDGMETDIIALEWSADGKLYLTYQVLNGSVQVLSFTPETEQFTTILCGLPADH